MKYLTGKYFMVRYFLLLNIIILFSSTTVLRFSPPHGGAGGAKPGDFYPQTPHGGLATAQLYRPFYIDNHNLSIYPEYINAEPWLTPPLWGGRGVNTGGADPIKIGLLIQTSASVEARHGAEIAIDEANKKGGLNGTKFELVVKSMEGPWGTGSKQAVDLIFQDRVVAIMGSHDGRNAHLVEQATTKSHIAFLSAWAGDPTLSQAFTPWFFSCVPSDRQQAYLLAKFIPKENYRTLTLISDEEYDAKSGLKSFIAIAEKEGIPKPVTIVTERFNNDIPGTCEMISVRKTDCLVLFTGPEIAEKIISRLEEMKSLPACYGPLSLLREGSQFDKHQDVLENILLLSGGDWHTKEKSLFSNAYKRKTGTWPGAVAAYAYDGMNAVIKAVIAANGDKDKIQKTLLDISIYGVTGSFKFDDKGNRIDLP
jgi:branched-chain amino acid transport system substrate-binding protein